MLAVVGVMTIETSTAGVAVNMVDPETVPDVALIVAMPVFTLAASPVLLIPAVAGVSEAQTAAAVRSFLVPSVKEPVAVNCWVVPRAIEGLAGVTAIETRAAAVTVSVVAPVIVPEVALIVDEPVPAVVARPCVPATLLMLALAGVSELHCTV